MGNIILCLQVAIVSIASTRSKSPYLVGKFQLNLAGVKFLVNLHVAVFWPKDCIMVCKLSRMKALVTICLLLSSVWMAGQTDITKKVSDALKSGNAELLSEYFTSNVDITILDDEDMYAKDQAAVKLNKFFLQNKPTGFTIKHQGTSKLDDQYRIGELVTDEGTYRVTFFMKKSGDEMKIKQIRVEELDDDF
jgi:hypothetical protein